MLFFSHNPPIFLHIYMLYRSNFLHYVGIDLIVFLHLSNHENKSIVTLIDYFRK